MASNQDILNSIYKDSSNAEYRHLVPVATGSNLNEIVEAFGDNDTVNIFLQQVVNKICKTIIANREFSNPLQNLKGDELPFGDKLEEIFVNPALSKEYRMNSSDLLKISLPDVKAIYYNVGRESKYDVSIYKEEIKKAVLEEGGLQRIVDKIVNSLYSGDNIAEFKLMKTAVGLFANEKTACKCYLGKKSAKDLTKEDLENILEDLQTTSENFNFPSSDFNNYTPVLTGERKAITFVPTDEQIIMIRSDILAKMNVKLLATLFNLDKANVMTRIIKVDNFNKYDEYTDTETPSNIGIVLMDRRLLKTNDRVKEFATFYNADTRQFKIYYHHHELIGASKFANVKYYILDTEPTESTGK